MSWLAQARSKGREHPHVPGAWHQATMDFVSRVEKSISVSFMILYDALSVSFADTAAYGSTWLDLVRPLEILNCEGWRRCREALKKVAEEAQKATVWFA